MAPKAEQERKNREKSVQDKCQGILAQMLKDEDNKYCVDCDSKGPRWASWNLGMFLCIRCAGMHRNLGVHISKVKSVNLDTWTPTQVASMQIMGNSRARAVYEANLPEDHRRPQTDNALEAFIRAKYEKKKYLAREWVPSKPPDFPEGWNDAPNDTDKVKKDFKKLGLPPVSGGTSPVNSTSPRLDKKPEQKPAAAAPTTSSSNVSPPAATSSAADLLGLTTQPQPLVSTTTSDLLGLDTFDAFVSAPAPAPVAAVSSPATSNQTQPAPPAKSPHAQPTGDLDEINFFNQEAPAVAAAVDSGKMTNDSILALFGSGAANKFPSQPQQFPSQPQQFPSQPQQFLPQRTLYTFKSSKMDQSKFIVENINWSKIDVWCCGHYFSPVEIEKHVEKVHEKCDTKPAHDDSGEKVRKNKVKKDKWILSGPSGSKTDSKKFSCSICHKTLKSNFDLIRHKTVHTKEKPFPCHICGISFSQRYNRNRHVQLKHGHLRKSGSPQSKRSSIPCSYANCLKLFGSKRGLGLHEKTHKIPVHQKTHNSAKLGCDLPPEPLQNEENYNIDDFDEEDSTDDENNPRKELPKWANGALLRNSLLNQCFNCPNLDAIFDIMDMPDLSKMFDKHQKIKFFKRNSSAQWDKPPSTFKLGDRW